MSDQLRFLWQILPNLLIGFPGQRPGGLALSVWLALVAISAGFVLANLIGVASASRWRLLRWFCRLYVEFFRGLPLVLLLLLVYQVVGNPRLGLNLTPYGAAIIALTFYTSAYQAEILRAGLASVPAQHVESARMMGSTPWHAYRSVKLRYALHTMLPAFTGQAISLFKDTSVVLIIGVADLMTVGRVALGSDVTNAPYWLALYLTVGALYFIVAFALSRVARRWERRTQTGDLVHSFANY
jgi:His/Glu/Gln/Arg/opine family amino acid ABC transporter permease subunit